MGAGGRRPARRLAPPRPPPAGAAVGGGSLGRVTVGRVQVLGRHQRLPVLLLRDGKHGHAHVLAIHGALAGGGGAGGGRGRRGGAGTLIGAAALRRVGQQAEAGRREARAPQVADRVEATLPLRRLGERVGGAAARRLRGGAAVRLGLQVDVGENLPTGGGPAVGC